MLSIAICLGGIGTYFRKWCRLQSDWLELEHNILGNGATYSRNTRLVAEVWMDDYKELLYQNRASARYAQIGAGIHFSLSLSLSLSLSFPSSLYLFLSSPLVPSLILLYIYIMVG